MFLSPSSFVRHQGYQSSNLNGVHIQRGKSTWLFISQVLILFLSSHNLPHYLYSPFYQPAIILSNILFISELELLAIDTQLSTQIPAF